MRLILTYAQILDIGRRTMPGATDEEIRRCLQSQIQAGEVQQVGPDEYMSVFGGGVGGGSGGYQGGGFGGGYEDDGYGDGGGGAIRS
jgi:hypothetical protein